MRLRLVPLALLALLLFCSAASASQVRYTPESGPLDSSGETRPAEFHYIADGGESNRLTVAGDATGFTFSDPGAVIQPVGGPCTSNGPHEVRCSAPEGNENLRVTVGDQGDRVAVGGTRAAGVDGGLGDDVLDGSGTSAGSVGLDGGGGDDELVGSPQSDLLDGGEGVNVLRGGAGGDSLEAREAADTLDGGPGSDTVGYRRNRPVTVDLDDPGPDGAAGENDVLLGVENVSVVGGNGDVLLGDEGPNVLAAGGGTNRVEGRGGNDRLIVATRSDVVSGGDGDDTIEANGKHVARRDQPITCGAGSDLVRAPGTTDLLERDCERVEYIYFFLSARPVALDTSRGIAAWRWSVECPSGYRCSALLTLRSGRTLLGQASLRVRDGSQRFHVRLTSAGRAFARAGRTSRVHVSVRRDRRRNTGGRVGRGETRTYGIRGLAP